MYEQSLPEITLQYVDLSDIQAEDEGHKITKNGICIENDSEKTEEHLKGIERVKKYLCNGNYIRPIVIRPTNRSNYKYQRMDGFCRYMAFKELDYKVIPCYIDMQAEYGCQDGEGIIV